MRTIKLTLAYDGTNYVGWQIQRSGLAVQEVVRRALERLTKEAIVLEGSGRTDAGVHALGQVASFRTRSKVPCEGLVRGLGDLLPKDIVILSADEAPDDFHARKSSRGKSYRYLLLESRGSSPFWEKRAWHIGTSLRLGDMRRAAKVLVGRHDFSSFRASGSSAKDSLRRITKI